MNFRLGLLFVLLAATLAAGWWLETAETLPETAIIPAARRLPVQPLAGLPASLPSVAEAGSTPRLSGGGADLFAAQSWKPPPPPPAKLVTPPPLPPQAPPLPFKYVGRWADDQGETVFLASGERVQSVRAGQRLEQWRLDKVSPDSLVFTYLPLDQQRSLRLTP